MKIKMKKIILSTMLTILSVVSHAQDFNVKKGKIFIDDEPAALIDKSKRVYTISSLDNTPKLSVVCKMIMYNNGDRDLWYEITDLGTNKMNEIPHENLTSAIGFEKSIVANLVKGSYPILTPKGIDEALLKKLTEAPPTGVSAGFEQKRQQVANGHSNALALYNEHRTEIDNAGTIYFDGKLGGRIVQSNLKSASGSPIFRYVVYDADKILVAEYINGMGVSELTKEYVNNEIVTIDKKKFPYKRESSIYNEVNKDPNARNIVATLLYNGYELGHQMSGVIQEQSKEEHEERVEALKESKERSSNIYNTKGYVIDENGEKLEGTINANFEEIKTGGNVADISSYGKIVLLKYENEKGKTKTKTFKSKDGVKFCLETGECYLGLKITGNSVANINPLSFDQSQFHKVLHDNHGFMLLVNPVIEKNLVIKIPGQEKGLYTRKTNTEKLKQNFDEYVKCSDIRFEDYNFTSQDDLIRLMDDCQNKCNN
jgi:hypothetical protein